MGRHLQADRATQAQALSCARESRLARRWAATGVEAAGAQALAALRAHLNSWLGALVTTARALAGAYSHAEVLNIVNDHGIALIGATRAGLALTDPPAPTSTS